MQPDLKRQRELVTPDPPDSSPVLPVIPRGTPAPPLETDELDRLFPLALGETEDGRKKKKKQPVKLLFTKMLFLLGALFLMVIGAVMAITTQVAMTTRDYDVAVTLGSRMGERIDAPDTLPSDALEVGVLTDLWQQGGLSRLEWHTWGIDADAGDAITISARSLDVPELLPIIGLYDAAGKRLTPPSVGIRSAEDKDFNFTIESGGRYWLLVGSIGGAAGKYEVRAEKQEAG